MKLSFLENFEEKFYFKTSHYFWHVVTALGGLALVVGVLILLWGITPSFKPGVKKPKYPEPVQVSLEEVQQKIQPPETKKAVKKAIQVKEQASTSKPKKIEPASADKDEVAYLASLDSLKSLLPSDKFPWKSRGHWEQSWYTKKWIVDVWGIEDRLKSVYKKVDANDFKLKKQLLDSYISMVALFPESERYRVLKAVIEFSKDNVNNSVNNVALLKQSVPLFSTEKAGFLKTLATFGRKNPRDGKKFIEYAIQIIPKFDPSIREKILSTLVSSYYNYFNLIDKQKEATNLFMGIYEKFDTDKQVKALSEYYKLYVKKNRDRERQIERINREYQSDQSRAESILYDKKAKKTRYRSLGLQVIGGSIVFIAFIALFLVLLSIQRNVRELKMEKLKEN